LAQVALVLAACGNGRSVLLIYVKRTASTLASLQAPTRRCPAHTPPRHRASYQRKEKQRRNSLPHQRAPHNLCALKVDAAVWISARRNGYLKSHLPLALFSPLRQSSQSHRSLANRSKRPHQPLTSKTHSYPTLLPDVRRCRATSYAKHSNPPRRSSAPCRLTKSHRSQPSARRRAHLPHRTLTSWPARAASSNKHG